MTWTPGGANNTPKSFQRFRLLSDNPDFINCFSLACKPSNPNP